MSTAYFLNGLQTAMFVGANNMNPDQTAPLIRAINMNPDLTAR